MTRRTRQWALGYSFLSCCVISAVLSCADVSSEANGYISLLKNYSIITVPNISSQQSHWKVRHYQVFITALPECANIRRFRIRGELIEGWTINNRGTLRLDYSPPLRRPDVLYSVLISLRSPAGGTLGVTFSADPDAPSLQGYIAQENVLTWSLRTPLIADTAVHIYELKSVLPVLSSNIRHVFIRPTNLAGAFFSIEFIRLVFQEEHLANIPRGLGWFGLSEIYQEGIAVRTPDTITMTRLIPENAKLELSEGPMEEIATIFQVTVRPVNKFSFANSRTFQSKVTTPNRWVPWVIDMSDFGGIRVSLSLSLKSSERRALAFWGNPVIRQVNAAGERQAISPKPQGVIVVWIDSIRKDHLDTYGYQRATAPVLRRVAQEGALFLDCVSQATWTKPSTTSLLTSLYPGTHRVVDFSDRLAPATVTLPRILRDAGYSTLSLSSILLTGRFSNLHIGFDEVHESSSFPDRDSSKTARLYVSQINEWLARCKDSPFFIFLHIFDPHDPYKPLPPYDRLWEKPAKVAYHERLLSRLRNAVSDPLLRRFGKPTEKELGRAGIDPNLYLPVEIGWYDGSIRGMDAEIGRLFNQLSYLKLDRKTLVVIAGDHGEEFLDHGRMFHGQSLYRELTDVPLIMWWPGRIPPGTVITSTVEIVDIMPTILSLASLPIPPSSQGVDLAPLLTAKSRTDHRFDERS